MSSIRLVPRLHGSVAHDAARERTTLMKLMSTPAVAILATLFLPWHGTFVVAQQQATAQAPQSSQRARPSPDAPLSPILRIAWECF